MSQRWKPAEAVYSLRPRENAIKGRKARNRRPMSQVPVFEPEEGGPSAATLVTGKEGFVSGLVDGDVLFAYSRNPSAAPADLDALLRTGSYQVLRIKWSMFESQFDVAG